MSLYLGGKIRQRLACIYKGRRNFSRGLGSAFSRDSGETEDWEKFDKDAIEIVTKNRFGEKQGKRLLGCDLMRIQKKWWPRRAQEAHPNSFHLLLRLSIDDVNLVQ